MAPLTGWPSSYHHRDAAERTGRRLGHGAQLFAGPEVLKILARVARGISGAAKGAQVAARLEEAAALQRGGTVAKEGQLASKMVTGERVGETIPKYVAYRAHWESRSLQEAIEKFTPGSTAVPGKKLHKLVYINKETRVKIIYDTKGKYFRIQDGEGYPLDWNGQRVHQLKNMSSQEATDFVLKNSHFNDID